MTRFALLSHVLPPSPSGQAVSLYRILAGIDPGAYYLISRETGEHEKEDSFHLPARHYPLPPESVLQGSNLFGWRHVRCVMNIIVRLIARKKNIMNVLRVEPATTAIVACSGDLMDIPAGFLASRKAHIPFYAYIFDDYVYQWTGKFRLLAKWIAPHIFKHAAGIIGPNEFLCEEYRQRYGVTPTLVRNPCAVNELAKEPRPQWPFESGKIKIIYTGAVYHANLDCFQHLLDAIALLPKHHLQLHIFTAQTREQLENLGIKGNQVFIHSHVLYDEILEQQRQADILFLPLAFASPIPKVIRTSAPGKMGEYLASGRPVLVHAPADSFIAHYFKKFQCGWIADKGDAQQMAAAIEEIIASNERRIEITCNARRQARRDFSPGVARNQLIGLIKRPEHQPASMRCEQEPENESQTDKKIT